MDFYSMVHGAYKGMQTCLYHQHGRRCMICGTHLGTAYLEEKLYAVCCPDCNTITLIEARSPDLAEYAVSAERAIELMKGNAAKK